MCRPLMCNPNPANRVYACHPEAGKAPAAPGSTMTGTVFVALRGRVRYPYGSL
jgi:hypothetical protein